MPCSFESNADEVLAELDRKCRAALEAVGNQAVSHAKQNIAAAGRINTGAMRNSVTHQVQNDTCYVGTNTKYAIYNEVGTGIHIAGGRKTPWAYQDEEGEWHRTRGMRPIHFLKNAVAGHTGEFKAIIEHILRR